MKIKIDSEELNDLLKLAFEAGVDSARDKIMYFATDKLWMWDESIEYKCREFLDKHNPIP